jgi:iron complex outermembrane receptor protein
MKVEHESIKNLQRKGTATLLIGTIPGVSQVSTGTLLETGNSWFERQSFVYSHVRIENQQFGDEHVWD